MPVLIENYGRSEKNDYSKKYGLESDLSFTLVMMTAITESNHPGFRTILKSNSEIICGIGYEDSVSALRVFSFDIIGFVNI